VQRGDPVEHLGRGDDLRPVPAIGVAHVHVLDAAQHIAAVAGELDQVEQTGLVHASA
jgi:hypothetical protein